MTGRQFLTGVNGAGQRAQNFGAASSPSDLVTLAQLQALINGVGWHQAVIAGSTGNVSLTAPGTALDGITLTNGQRILLKNQTTGSQNGIYVFNGSSAALTLAADSVQGELTGGAAVYVESGTTNADTAWTLITDDPITIGTTSLSFAQFGGGVAYTAGTGLTLIGTQFAVDTTKVVRKYAQNVGDGSSTTVTVTHSLGTLDIEGQVYLISSGETVECDFLRTGANTVSLTFAVAPASGAYRVVIQG